MVDGAVSGPAHVSSATSPCFASGFDRPFVIVSTKLRVRCLLSSAARLTISALAPDWLTIVRNVLAFRIGRRKCSSSAVLTSRAEMPRLASSFTAG